MKRGVGFGGGFVGVDKRNASEGVIGWEKNFFKKALALDKISVTGLVRAYSTRRLISTYEGALLKVRNSSSGVVTNISYLGEDLDTASLLSTLASASGSISELSDQSGVGAPLAQGIATQQPRLVNAGIIETIGSKPAMVLDGSDDNLVSSSLITGLANNNAFTIMVVFSKSNNNYGTIINQGRDASYFHFGLVTGASNNAISWRNSNYDYVFGSNTNSANQAYVMCAVSSGGVTELFRNNVSVGITNNAIVASNPVTGNELAIGKRAGHSSEFAAIKLSEVIILTRALSTEERSVLVNDAINYFTIP
jgi:hypothetical protein